MIRVLKYAGLVPFVWLIVAMCVYVATGQDLMPSAGGFRWFIAAVLSVIGFFVSVWAWIVSD